MCVKVDLEISDLVHPNSIMILLKETKKLCFQQLMSLFLWVNKIFLFEAMIRINRLVEKMEILTSLFTGRLNLTVLWLTIWHIAERMFRTSVLIYKISLLNAAVKKSGTVF